MAKPKYTFMAATVITLFVLNQYVFQMSKNPPSSQREKDNSTLLSSTPSRLDENPKNFIKREVMTERAKLKSCPDAKLNSSHPQFVKSIRLINEFSCADILLHVNDTNKRTRVRKKPRVENLSSVSYHEDEYYLNAARHCNRFKLQFGYRTSLMEGDDPDYPIAFNILTHRSVAQVERLLRAIYRPHNSYCIHIDAKANETFQRALRAVVSCFDNVFVASKLEYVVYAGYSRLQADVNCMTDQLNSSIKWRYLINTAANAYPLKTNAEITKILKIYNGANDVKATAYGRYSSLKRRWKYKHIEPDVAHGDPDEGVIPTQQRLSPPPHNLAIVKGSAYAVFSRGFVDYIINDKVAQDYLRFCRDTFSPDEHYWNTLHHTYYNPHIHPPGAFSGRLAVEKPWMGAHVIWNSKYCYGRMQRAHCVYGVGDLPVLIKRPEIIANRIEVTFEPLTIDCLEAWHRHKEQCPPAFDEAFYRSLPFIYNSTKTKHRNRLKA